MKTNKILGIFFVSLLIVSCSAPADEVLMKDVGSSWNSEKEYLFDFEIEDALNPKNIIFVVRNNNDYPYSNLRLIANFTDLETKKTETDTLNYELAKPNGEWIGSGFGSTKETLFQYRMDYQFPKKGPYRIGVIQAMRNDTLRGIEDIGVKIEQIKP